MSHLPVPNPQPRMSRLSFECQHRYGADFALDVAFATDAPVTALVGPSGSGKTTVLALVAGLLRPQTGKIVLGERTLTDTAKRICLRPEARRIGYLPQEHSLFPHLSVLQNLEYGRRRRPWRKLDMPHVIETLELNDLLDRQPATLSGGQKQRVALGRALLRGPELLLMDEPVTGLEAKLQRRVLDFVRRVVDEFHIPTLLVSHSMENVRRLAEHVIVLHAGRCLAAGSPDEVAV